MNKWTKTGLAGGLIAALACAALLGIWWGSRGEDGGGSSPAVIISPPDVNVTVTQSVNGADVSTTATTSESGSPKIVTGDFKASIYRLSDDWFLNSFRESSINTDSGPLSRLTEDVSIKWVGTFLVLTPGQYQFSTTVVDADIYVDDVRVVDIVNLSGGAHRLTFGPFLKPAGETVRLYWQKV